MKFGIISNFKKCACGVTWKDRDDFLFDKNTKIIGYEPDFNNLENGTFVFTHSLCKAKIGIKTAEFTDLYDGPVYQERNTGGNKCFKYCLYNDKLNACPAKCGCAYIRAVIQIIKKWPKTK